MNLGAVGATRLAGGARHRAAVAGGRQRDRDAVHLVVFDGVEAQESQHVEPPPSQLRMVQHACIVAPPGSLRVEQTLLPLVELTLVAGDLSLN